MFSKLWNNLSTWVSSWFSPSGRAKVVEVLNNVSVFIDYALPIVEAIDMSLKPVIRDAQKGVCTTPIACLIGDFLSKYGVSDEVAESHGRELQGLPLADMLVNVALLALKQVKPESASSSILRLAIELAYNVYKSTRSEGSTDAVV